MFAHMCVHVRGVCEEGTHQDTLLSTTDEEIGEMGSDCSRTCLKDEHW